MIDRNSTVLRGRPALWLPQQFGQRLGRADQTADTAQFAQIEYLDTSGTQLGSSPRRAETVGQHEVRPQGDQRLDWAETVDDQLALVAIAILRPLAGSAAERQDAVGLGQFQQQAIGDQVGGHDAGVMPSRQRMTGGIDEARAIPRISWAKSPAVAAAKLNGQRDCRCQGTGIAQCRAVHGAESFCTGRRKPN
jgi:hypothetical protein